MEVLAQKKQRITSSPSPLLVELFRSFSCDFTNPCEKWEKIVGQGAEEGFTEDQLRQMVRPYLKERGLSKDQIYYFFHKEEQKERVRRRKITMMHPNTFTSTTGTMPTASKIPRVIHFNDLSSHSNLEFPHVNEVQTLEFDLRQALDMGLRDAVQKAEITSERSCKVKIYAKDGFVMKIETKLNGCEKWISSI